MEKSDLGTKLKFYDHEDGQRMMMEENKNECHRTHQIKLLDVNNQQIQSMWESMT
jgi:hypothetical protein